MTCRSDRKRVSKRDRRRWGRYIRRNITPDKVREMLSAMRNASRW